MTQAEPRLGLGQGLGHCLATITQQSLPSRHCAAAIAQQSLRVSHYTVAINCCRYLLCDQEATASCQGAAAIRVRPQ